MLKVLILLRLICRIYHFSKWTFDFQIIKFWLFYIKHQDLRRIHPINLRTLFLLNFNFIFQLFQMSNPLLVLLLFHFQMINLKIHLILKSLHYHLVKFKKVQVPKVFFHPNHEKQILEPLFYLNLLIKIRFK